MIAWNPARGLSAVDTAPSPWWCETPTWLPWPFGLTREERSLCQYAGLETRPPAGPVVYPYLGPEQTPAAVIAAQAEAQRRAAEEEAARLASDQARQIDLNRWRYQIGFGEGVGEEIEPDWILWGLLGVGALVAIKAVK